MAVLVFDEAFVVLDSQQYRCLLLFQTKPGPCTRLVNLENINTCEYYHGIVQLKHAPINLAPINWLILLRSWHHM